MGLNDGELATCLRATDNNVVIRAAESDTRQLCVVTAAD